MSYDSSLSLTFQQYLKSFSLSYLDHTQVTGSICSDFLVLGNQNSNQNPIPENQNQIQNQSQLEKEIENERERNVHGFQAYFGCISLEKHQNVFSKNILGILGLSFPSPSSSSEFSTNLFDFLSLSIPQNQNQLIQQNNIVEDNPMEYNQWNQTQTIPRVFTLILSPFSSVGLLQLGGYDLISLRRSLSDIPIEQTYPLSYNASFTISLLREECKHIPHTTSISPIHVPSLLSSSIPDSHFQSQSTCPYRNYRVGISKIRLGECLLDLWI
jgi:hypothetical protein